MSLLEALRSLKILSIFSFVCLVALRSPALAVRGGAYTYSSTETVIGMEDTYVINGNETLLEVARLFDLGYNEIVAANPDVDPWVPPAGTVIRVPTIWILPETMDEGIVINIAEMRLYYFFMVGGYRMVRTFPIGIGRQGLSTPLGSYRIVAKVKDPTWYPPQKAREEDPSLPPSIPPGPDNPLGGYWLQLSIPGYGIHGTNRPWGIGRRVSRGCIRLYPEDMEWLFERVKVGTEVRIVDRPVKIGLREKRLYIEVHREGGRGVDYEEIVKMIGGPSSIDRKGLLRALREANGIPTVISRE